MAAPITLSVPRPCSEKWDNMRPAAAGRHCASCQETVADFTRLSDAEIVAYLHHHPAVSCGRFRESQLQRPLWLPAQSVAGWQRWVAATVALLGLGALTGPKAQGQTAPAYWGGPAPAVPAGSNTVPAAPSIAADDTPAAAGSVAASVSSIDSLIVRGVVHDRLGLPRAGAWVKVKARIGGLALDAATTDAHGAFRLVVPRSAMTDESIIQVMAVSHREDAQFYLDARVPLDVNRTRPYRIHLKKHERIHGGKFR